MKRALTHREAELLEFLRTHLSAYGFAPSMDEIAVHLGLKAKSNVHTLIGQLERKGRIRRIRYRARSIQVLPSAAIDGSNARYVADLLLVNAMSNPAPAALAAVIAAQWDAAGKKNMPSIARIA